jgi:hypothetical protein
MYSRAEASKLRQDFWLTFGQYMAPVLSAEGLRTNWVNYKTGVKNISFKMQADTRTAFIAIEITHPDPEIQQWNFEQFQALKSLIEESLEEEWTWALHTTDEHGKTISRIYTEIASVNIFNKEDWPTLISFFKPRIIALDQFWSDAKYTFEELG